MYVDDIVSGKSVVSPGAKQGLLPLTIPLVRISPGMIRDMYYKFLSEFEIFSFWLELWVCVAMFDFQALQLLYYGGQQLVLG